MSGAPNLNELLCPLELSLVDPIVGTGAATTQPVHLSTTLAPLCLLDHRLVIVF